MCSTFSYVFSKQWSTHINARPRISPHVTKPFIMVHHSQSLQEYDLPVWPNDRLYAPQEVAPGQQNWAAFIKTSRHPSNSSKVKCSSFPVHPKSLKGWILAECLSAYVQMNLLRQTKSMAVHIHKGHATLCIFMLFILTKRKATPCSKGTPNLRPAKIQILFWMLCLALGLPSHRSLMQRNPSL